MLRFKVSSNLPPTSPLPASSITHHLPIIHSRTHVPAGPAGRGDWWFGCLPILYHLTFAVGGCDMQQHAAHLRRQLVELNPHFVFE